MGDGRLGDGGWDGWDRMSVVVVVVVLLLEGGA